MINPKTRIVVGFLLILVGIILFPILFYTIQEFVFVEGKEDESNVVAFLTGLTTFLTFCLIGLGFIISGNVMRKRQHKPQ